MAKENYINTLELDNAELKKGNAMLTQALKDTERTAFEIKYELEKENKKLKEQLKPNYYVKGLEGTLKEYQQEMNKVVIQQKEFIKYLEDEIKQNTPSLRWKHYNEDGFNDYDVQNPSCIEVRPTDKIFKEILQKYKKITGLNNE